MVSKSGIWTAVLVVVFSSGVAARVIERVSVDSTGIEGNGESSLPASERGVSADGRYVAFQSDADNLVVDDDNGWSDVFVRDRAQNTTIRVSVDRAGGDANGPSLRPSISADGRYVAFESAATDLVDGDLNFEWDVFVRDLDLGQTIRVSVSTVGGDADNDSSDPSISADGRYVAFVSYAQDLVAQDWNFRSDIFVRDLQQDETVMASVGWDGSGTDENSWAAVISADGRHAAFASAATNLVDDDGNGETDVFVRDLELDETTRASVDQGGGDANARSRCPSISTDGRYVVFCSPATDLVIGDTNGVDDLFVRDVVAETTSRINLTSTGEQTIGAGSWHPSISGDGRFVAFLCDADNLVPEDNNGYSDVLIRDLGMGTTTLVSVDDAGNLGDEWSGNPSISADGRLVIFESTATNLVDDDTNGMMDVFIARGPVVFFDSFESGDTSAWSNTVP